MATSTEDRALKLLGDGFSAEVVATAIGVSPSRISQLMSDPVFSQKVSELRFKSLSKHSERDSRYDGMEDALIDRMEKLLPMMFKPMEVLRALDTINKVKRKGISNPEAITAQQEVTTLILPTAIVQHFTTNNFNQVVKVGEKDLVTIQSGSMNDLLDGINRNEQTSSPQRIGISSSESTIRAARQRTGSGTSSEIAEDVK